MNHTNGIAPDKLLSDAIATLRQRGTDYDGKGYQSGERSMVQTVAIFHEITGISLSEREGWYFMLCLKIARSTTGKPKPDTFVDMAGYTALLGECALAERLTPNEPSLAKSAVTDAKGVSA